MLAGLPGIKTFRESLRLLATRRFGTFWFASLLSSIGTWAQVVGVTDALSMPSFQSIVPSIVAHEEIGNGLALNSTQFNLSRILGPSIAGVLMSSVGVVACFVVSAVSYVPFIGIALWILPRWIPEPARTSARPRPHPLASIRDVLRHRNLRGALLTVLATSILCSPLVTFSPVLVKEVFHGGAGSLLGVQHALLLNGLVAVAAQAALARMWLRAPSPEPRVT